MKNGGARRKADRLDAVEVRCSAVHGLGLFARGSLKAGELISDYHGRRLGAEEVVTGEDEGIIYLFALSGGGYIDGRQGGNATRHLNHSCAPNCHAQEYRGSGGRLGIRIRTLVPVEPDEELSLDYALIIDATEKPEDYPCHCGAATCRGSLVAVDSS